MRFRAAFKMAVRDAIRQNCNLKDAECDVTPPPGRPHSNAGKVFVAVWDGPRQWEHSGSVMMRMGVNVTVSWKVNAPHDRFGTKEIDLTDDEEGLNELMGRIAAMLFAKQWDIVAKIDANLSASAIRNGIIEAPRPLSDGPPEECTHDWFGGIPPVAKGNFGRGSRNPPIGYKCTLTYGGALVGQYLSEGTG